MTASAFAPRSVWRLFVVAVFAVAGSMFSPQTAYAASGYSLFGDAMLASGNSSPTGVQLRSSPTYPQWGGIDFDVPAGMTFSDVTMLATDYKFTENSCGGGSPRFQINVGGVNAFVYIGPAPNYTGCVQGSWQTTGNLAAPSAFVDTAQLGGGPYQTFADAVAVYGDLTVTGIQLVVDAGWFFENGVGTQTVIVDNVVINGTTYTFESAQSCKGDGWQTFTSDPGPFKNQGDCVSYFASAGRNLAAP